MSNLEILKIHDINGRCVWEKQIPKGNYVSVDLSMLKIGFYVLNYRTKNEVLVKKFIINNQNGS